MPLELLLRIPPIMHVFTEAGSGPILAPKARSASFTRPPITPGWTRTRLPPSSTASLRQCRPTSTRIPSVTAWPERLVPAARNVMGTRRARLRRKRAWTSSRLRDRTTAWGIRR